MTPSGTSTQPVTSGPIESSPAIGRNASGADVVFYMTTDNGLRALGGNPCGTASASNVGSVAILHDGTPSLRAAGVVQVSASPALRAVDTSGCATVGANGVLGMSFPGNMVTDGTGVWYPADTGDVQRATAALSSVSNGCRSRFA